MALKEGSKRCQGFPGRVGRVVLFSPGPDGRVDGLTQELSDAAMRVTFRLPLHLHPDTVAKRSPTVTYLDNDGNADYAEPADSRFRQTPRVYRDDLIHTVQASRSPGRGLHRPTGSLAASEAVAGSQSLPQCGDGS